MHAIIVIDGANNAILETVNEYCARSLNPQKLHVFENWTHIAETFPVNSHDNARSV